LDTPSIGETYQHFFTNVQVNISPAGAGCKCFSKLTVCNVFTLDTAATFESSLGQFAVPHVDKQDSGAALTAMTLQVSAPENYHYSGFFYHDFGVRIKGVKLAIVYFTGRHRHGAATPSPPPGETPVHWVYHVAVICYPNGPTMEGKSRNPLAPFCGFDFLKKDPKAGDNER